MCTYLGLGLPELYYSRFNEIFVDQWVDSGNFRDLFSQCTDDWKSSQAWSLRLLMANILISSIPGASQLVGLSAIIMCGLSAISAITLCLRDADFANARGKSALSRLNALRSDTYGFRPAGLIFSLPRVLFLWGLGLLMAQAVFLTFRLVHSSVTIGMATLVLLAVLATGRVISVEDPWCGNRLVQDWFHFFQRHSTPS